MGFIPPETIEAIAAANDIVEVIGTYFPLKRAGSSWRALCPFHQERSPSFHVSPARQSYHCFGCGAGGSVFRFVMEYERLDFPAAARKLAERGGVRIIEEEFNPEADRRVQMRRRLLALHAETARWFHANLLGPLGREARTYLKSRGINREIAERWLIGFAPESWDGFSAWARAQKYAPAELVQSGLVKLRDEENAEGEFYDRFRGRVVFPIANPQGEVIAFTGRVLDPEASAAKYLNSPETMLFKKGSVLFGLDKTQRALHEKDSAIICEGQLDLITAYEAGITNVTAAQGTAFTEEQARLLKRHVPEVVLCFDSDAAGQKAATRSLPALLAADLAVRVIEMPRGADPDSLIRQEGPAAFLALIGEARDFFDHQLERLAAAPAFASPRGKLDAARQLAEFVRHVREPIIRESLTHRIAARLEVPAAEFVRLLQTAPGPAADLRAGAEATPRRRALPRDMTLHLLTVLALRHAPSRPVLQQERVRPLLAAEEGSELLRKIVEANLDAGREETRSAFLATLPAEEEAEVARLLLEELPAEPDAVREDCLRDLERRGWKRLQAALQARLRLPDLAGEQVAEVQKQILDLQQRLTDIARPFSPPSP